MSTDASDIVFFPPREVADFVIHYDKHFHVHKFVLHHHSAYFRAYFLTLSPQSDVYIDVDIRPASDSSPAIKRPKRCNHPTIAHCIHLPQQITLVDKDDVDADDFELFLCHLYFSAHYCYPPCLPKTDIDLEMTFHRCPSPSAPSRPRSTGPVRRRRCAALQTRKTSHSCCTASRC